MKKADFTIYIITAFCKKLKHHKIEMAVHFQMNYSLKHVAATSGRVLKSEAHPSLLRQQMGTAACSY